jgi:hypothetical protein
MAYGTVCTVQISANWNWKLLTDERKKELMHWTRTPYRKAEEGFLQVLQKGNLIEKPSEKTVKGIIRLRLAS